MHSPGLTLVGHLQRAQNIEGIDVDKSPCGPRILEPRPLDDERVGSLLQVPGVVHRLLEPRRGAVEVHVEPVAPVQTHFRLAVLGPGLGDPGKIGALESHGDPSGRVVGPFQGAIRSPRLV